MTAQTTLCDTPITAAIEVRLRRLSHGADLPLPHYASAGAVGMDLRAAVGAQQPFYLDAGARAAIPTGLCLELPEGYEAQIRSRSGLALRFGVSCANAPGTIDWDYRGEVKVILINQGQDRFAINHGDRIAQMVFAPVTRAQLLCAEALAQTKRGSDGFGSTGQN